MRILASILFIALNFSTLSTAKSLDMGPLRPMLNSERIERLFGSYGVEVLPITSSEFREYRVANLYSLHENKKVTRTLALVRYVSPVSTALENVHKRILGGESIGSAFKKSGWNVIKDHAHFGEFKIEGGLKTLMQTDGNANGSLHIYDLSVENAKTLKTVYCRIIEIHSPLYLDKERLKALYPTEFFIHRLEENTLAPLLLNISNLTSTL